MPGWVAVWIPLALASLLYGVAQYTVQLQSTSWAFMQWASLPTRSPVVSLGPGALVRRRGDPELMSGPWKGDCQTIWKFSHYSSLWSWSRICSETSLHSQRGADSRFGHYSTNRVHWDSIWTKLLLLPFISPPNIPKYIQRVKMVTTIWLHAVIQSIPGG